MKIVVATIGSRSDVQPYINLSQGLQEAGHDVLSHAIDEFYWWQRVDELGVGPKPISRGKLDAQKLSEAILACKNDGDMRQKAREIGEKICLEEDGVSVAVRAIVNLL